MLWLCEPDSVLCASDCLAAPSVSCMSDCEILLLDPVALGALFDDRCRDWLLEVSKFAAVDRGDSVDCCDIWLDACDNGPLVE